jgi:hypothetical protein
MDEPQPAAPSPETPPAAPELNGNGVFSAMDEPPEDLKGQIARDVKVIGHVLRDYEKTLRSVQQLELVLIVCFIAMLVELELVRRGQR